MTSAFCKSGGKSPCRDKALCKQAFGSAPLRGGCSPFVLAGIFRGFLMLYCKRLSRLEAAQERITEYVVLEVTPGDYLL